MHVKLKGIKLSWVTIGCIYLLVFSPFKFLMAQKTDTLIVSSLESVHSPKRASILSAALPGAGQVYNKKYWKVPVLYAGFGVLTYFTISNWKDYQKYREAYIIRNDTDPNTYDQYDLSDPNFSGDGGYSNENLNYIQSTYRRYFELSCIGLGLLYVLNIVDASVDAHLFYFDISDKLSLNIQPILSPNPDLRALNSGINCTLTF